MGPAGKDGAFAASKMHVVTSGSVMAPVGQSTLQALCASGDILISGGCQMSASGGSLRESTPILQGGALGTDPSVLPNGWECQFNIASIGPYTTAYALCYTP